MGGSRTEPPGEIYGHRIRAKDQYLKHYAADMSGMGNVRDHTHYCISRT